MIVKVILAARSSYCLGISQNSSRLRWTLYHVTMACKSCQAKGFGWYPAWDSYPVDRHRRRCESVPREEAGKAILAVQSSHCMKPRFRSPILQKWRWVLCLPALGREYLQSCQAMEIIRCFVSICHPVHVSLFPEPRVLFRCAPHHAIRASCASWH